MKRACLWLWLLLRQYVFAAITLDFDRNGGESTSKEILFEDVTKTHVSEVGATESCFKVAAASQALSGANGSIRVTLTAKELTDGESDVSSWSLGSNATIHSNENGLGVKSAKDHNLKNGFAAKEAMVLAFDFTDLILDSGFSLVFSVLSDAGETYRIYKRTGTNKARRIFSMSSNSPTIPSSTITVTSRYMSATNVFEFAIMDVGWSGGGRLRIKSFSIDSAVVKSVSDDDSEIILDFQGGDEAKEKLFRFSDVNADSPKVSDVGANAPCFRVSPISTNLPGASGSLVVTWTGKGQTGDSDPTSWAFGPDAVVECNQNGLGIMSRGETGSANQMRAGEAFVVSFDTSELRLSPGNQLMFSVLTGVGETYRIFQRVGDRSSVEVFAMASSATLASSNAILVNAGYQSYPGIYEFAIAKAGWDGGNSLRVTQFSVGLAGSFSTADYTPPSFHPIFTSNMVLQRDAEVKIYGTATPYGRVTVEISVLQQTVATNADREGRWSVTFAAMQASYTPCELSLSDGIQTIQLDNILIGDVWLCSGQSNMDRGFELYKSLNTSGLNNPHIRLVQLERGGPKTPAETLMLTAELGGSWQECTNTYLAQFSPAAYFFGASMEANNSVPMGLMHVAMGATSIEMWTSAEVLKSIGIDPNSNDTYTRNYNGMIYPLRNFVFKGVLWYQGESNSENPFPYERLFSGMISSWRTLFNRGDIPFYFAQLASHGSRDWDVTDTAKPLLRDAQKAALTLTNTRMIVLTDAGEYLSIHPENKMAVGERFARHALVAEGRRGINTDSPTFEKLKIVNDKIIITFLNVGDGLETRELKMNYNEGLAQGNDIEAFVVPANQLWGFQIAGLDEVFVEANATITDSDQVTVWSEHIPNPVAVRYCFKWFVLCNLYASNDGWVATPFRTDNFPVANFAGNSSGTVFEGSIASLGVPMDPSTTFGPSTISPITLDGIDGYSINGTGLRLMYFSTSNRAFQNGPKPYVLLEILYYDQGSGFVNLRYDVGLNSTALAPLRIMFRNSSKWRVAKVALRDAMFGKQVFGYDLRAQCNTSDFILGGVYLSGPTVTKLPKGA